MQLPVRIKQCKYMTDIVRQNQLPHLLSVVRNGESKSELEVFDTVYLKCLENELFNKVWADIEREANRIVEEECKPEWDRILKQMEEAKTKIAELNEKEEKDEEAIRANQEIVDWLIDEYQKVSDTANAKLNEFKESYINNNYKDATCFLLDEEEYNIINRITWWSVYDGKNDTNIVVPETKEN